MTPDTSTQASDVPHQPNTTNQLSLLKVHGGSPTLTGFTLQGTEQGHLYNDLRLASTHNATVLNAIIGAIPGDSGYPPGETFGITDFHTTGTTCNGVPVNGAGVGAAGLGFNDYGRASSRDTICDNIRRHNI